ncbi:restriction endonuclease [Caenimonas sedimenti]|uniref:Restriction endonuclease n=1 Tax=Caenimonas sedimenti TaxID=2596921 RepID=A0A562ZQ11_9BURK|nr:restriction endonuclease [Caenimonas sedimenti]TWO70418.1 restriction endonuclease [Caenimonas sedimenti]
MHIMYRKPTELPPAGMLLGKGVAATALGTTLLGAAALLAPSTHPLLHAAAGSLRVLAPYALACGAAALITWLVLRPIRPAATATSDPQAPASHWSEPLFQQLTPQGFTAICGELFAQPGRRIRVERIDAESADLWLHPADAMRPVELIQCRQWAGHLAGVKELRELQGAMVSRDVARGTFVTTSGFTADARRFARAHGIALVDVHDLLALVERRSPAQQCDLVAFAWTAR